MRRIVGLLVLMMFVLLLISGFAFGRDNSKPASTGGNHDDSIVGHDTANLGYISIIFTQQPAEASSFNKSGSASTSDLTDAPSARVTIRQVRSTVANEDCAGYPFYSTVTTNKKVIDISTAGTTTIAVAPGTGYKVDVITYRVSSATTPPHNSILQYGLISNVTVTAGQRNDLTISLSPINVALQPSTSTVDSSLAAVRNLSPTTNYFSIAYSTKGFPLRTEKNLRVSITSVELSGFYDYDPSLTLSTPPAPIVNMGDSNKIVYLQGVFFLDDDHLRPGENYTDWRYYEPNYPDLHDPPISKTILSPSRTVTVMTDDGC